MVEIFNNFIFIPLYNAFVFLIDILPWHSAALAVIILTILVKLALLPSAKKIAHTQKKMQEIMPEIEKIKQEHKDDPQTQALKTMELYRKEGVKPFSSFVQLFVQLPIIFALYWVFFKAGLPNIKTELLYSFIPKPEFVNMHFLGISLSDKSIILAFLVGITQYLYAKMANTIQVDEEDKSIKADFQRSMQLQMLYVLPVIMTVVAYTFSSAIALYFLTSNLFLIGQEYYFKKKGIK